MLAECSTCVLGRRTASYHQLMRVFRGFRLDQEYRRPRGTSHPSIASRPRFCSHWVNSAWNGSIFISFAFPPTSLPISIYHGEVTKDDLCDLGGVKSTLHKAQCAARFKFTEVHGRVDRCTSFSFLLSHRSLANRVAEAPGLQQTCWTTKGKLHTRALATLAAG